MALRLLRPIYSTKAQQEEINRIKAETERLKKETALTEEVTNQNSEKARRYSEYLQTVNQQKADNNSKAMLSGLTGFAKIRRRVLGSNGGLGTTDERLGG